VVALGALYGGTRPEAPACVCTSVANLHECFAWWYTSVGSCGPPCSSPAGVFQGSCTQIERGGVPNMLGCVQTCWGEGGGWKAIQLLHSEVWLQDWSRCGRV
jgi:hypothetical protein